MLFLGFRNLRCMATTAYRLKHTYFQGRQVAFCLQNANGPCPLLAIANVLSLWGRITFPQTDTFVLASTLFQHVSRLVACKSSSKPSLLNSNEEKVIQDALSLLPKLQSGIDLNVQFSDITSFEYTTECSVFDLLGVPLVHGWMMDDRPGSSAPKIFSLCLSRSCQIAQSLLQSNDRESD